MFAQLKELKYFTEIRFQESYNVKHFKEIKRFKSFQNEEAYLEPFSVNILNGVLLLQ